MLQPADIQYSVSLSLQSVIVVKVVKLISLHHIMGCIELALLLRSIHGKLLQEVFIYASYQAFLNLKLIFGHSCYLYIKIMSRLAVF